MSRKSDAAARVQKLQRKLDRIQARQRRQFLNENVLRLEKSGNISYERVRTFASDPATDAASAGSATPAAPATSLAQNPAISNFVPNNVPQTPVNQENGTLFGGFSPALEAAAVARQATEVTPAAIVTAASDAAASAPPDGAEAGIKCHEAPDRGTLEADSQGDPLTELLGRAIAAARVRRGRPAAFDERAKGQLAALLAVGMSLRQAASVLGVSHTTVQRTLAADPALAEEITAARFQAQLQPLACVIREARRSWKAATWLLKYLDGKVASHEETPDERRQRQFREADDFFARSPRKNVKTRKELA